MPRRTVTPTDAPCLRLAAVNGRRLDAKRAPKRALPELCTMVRLNASEAFILAIWRSADATARDMISRAADLLAAEAAQP